MPATLRRLVLLLLVLALGPAARAPAEPAFPLQARRILFLGDSITHAGHYVAWIETQFRLQGVEPLPEIVNIGLASETCSGLSEPDHPFPRPTSTSGSTAHWPRSSPTWSWPATA